jgi:hypothetical protein
MDSIIQKLVNVKPIDKKQVKNNLLNLKTI